MKNIFIFKLLPVFALTDFSQFYRNVWTSPTLKLPVPMKLMELRDDIRFVGTSGSISGATEFNSAEIRLPEQDFRYFRSTSTELKRSLRDFIQNSKVSENLKNSGNRQVRKNKSKLPFVFINNSFTF